ERSLLDTDDVHAAERQHVMRETLLEMLSGEESTTINKLMEKTKDFSRKYHDRYKVYVSSFSINKIISDIEIERINYLSKVHDSLISQQGKAFAIPGVMIAIGAVLRFSGSTWDSVLIVM